SHWLQLCCYADLLEAIQGVRPAEVAVALGDGSVERLRVEDVFAFYRALRASFEVLDLEDVVASALSHVEPRIEQRPVAVEIPEGATVLADPVLLEEVLVNLLENAARHTPDGTSIRITATEAGPGNIGVTVEDAGPGVPPEALPRLFDTFYRVPGAGGTARRGTGIGLAVVRGLVAALGGTVRARSSRLGGLAIDLELRAAPLARQTATEPAAPGPERGSLVAPPPGGAY
ncbi:MAG: hypothetical protein EHM52_00120, partial [Actinomycetota bacterium]